MGFSNGWLAPPRIYYGYLRQISGVYIDIPKNSRLHSRLPRWYQHGTWKISCLKRNSIFQTSISFLESTANNCMKVALWSHTYFSLMLAIAGQQLRTLTGLVNSLPDSWVLTLSLFVRACGLVSIYTCLNAVKKTKRHPKEGSFRQSKIGLFERKYIIYIFQTIMIFPGCI